MTEKHGGSAREQNKRPEEIENESTNRAIVNLAHNLGIIECLHMTSRRPYWCPKTVKRRPCWCPKPIL